jgi:hypothetical protein
MVGEAAQILAGCAGSASATRASDSPLAAVSTGFTHWGVASVHLGSANMARHNALAYKTHESPWSIHGSFP